MDTLATTLNDVNRNLGMVLADARSRRHCTITACAAVVGTSRRRYAAIERGDVPITFAELVLLAQYFDLPVDLVWPETIARALRYVDIEASPGDTVVFRVR